MGNKISERGVLPCSGVMKKEGEMSSLFWCKQIILYVHKKREDISPSFFVTPQVLRVKGKAKNFHGDYYNRFVHQTIVKKYFCTYFDLNLAAWHLNIAESGLRLNKNDFVLGLFKLTHTVQYQVPSVCERRDRERE